MSVTTITGANDFMRKAELRRRIDAFVTEHGELALERIDAEEVEFNRLHEALTSLPFLASHKLVVIAQPSGNTAFADKAEVLLSELPDTTDVIFVEPKFDKRSGLYKLLKKQSEFIEYAALDGPALVQWLVERATAAGAKLTTGEARYLVERVGNNQQLLANEIDKLALYQPNITRQTIDELTEKTPQSTIFELIESAFSGNPNRALELYEEQRRLKVEPIQIIAMLAWQLHVLSLVVAADGRSADAIASEAKLNPFTVKKTQRLAARLGLPQVRTFVDNLVVIDRRSKRETFDLDEALRHYILQLGA